MQIKKEYKFYYGHRNQELNDKCFRPHGHDAKIFFHFNVERNGNLTTLFSDFDSQIEPLLKNEFDHRFIIDINDKLYHTLLNHEENFKESLGVKALPFPTSVENVSFYLFHRVYAIFPNLEKMEYQETRSSTVTYTFKDYIIDSGGELGHNLKKFLLSEKENL